MQQNEELIKKEDIIAKMYEDFHRIYTNEITPKFHKLETLRLNKLSLAKKISIVLAIILLIPILWAKRYELIFPALGISAAPFAIISKLFAVELKEKLMPILLSAFPSFSYEHDKAVSKGTIEETLLFNDFNQYNIDDSFMGEFQKVKADMFELHLQKEVDNGQDKDTLDVFKGLIINLKLPQNYQGTTIIYPNRECHNLPQRRHKDIGLNEVKLEDVDFAKEHVIVSNDQVEARYIFTPSFMQRYKKVKDIFNSNVKACFRNNYATFAISCNKDLFEIGSLLKPIKDPEQFKQFFNEFCLLFELIVELRFNENIGL